MNLGIDLGRVIVGPRIKGTESFISRPMENSFEVISKLVKKFNNTYIVSRVNDAQRERAIKWLEDNNFYSLTGIPKENVYFCFDRRDKHIFVRGLNINVFIDDRLDCLLPMDGKVIKILFNPEEQDLDKHKDIKHDSRIVNNWLEIEKLISRR